MNYEKTPPKGFENRPEQGATIYKTGAPKQSAPPTVNFRGRPGGPGRGSYCFVHIYLYGIFP